MIPSPSGSVSARFLYLLAGLALEAVAVLLVWSTATRAGWFGNVPPVQLLLLACFAAAALLARATLYLPAGRGRTSAWRLVGGIALTAVFFSGLTLIDVYLYFAFGGDLRT